MTHMKRLLGRSWRRLSALSLSLFLLPQIVLAQQFQVPGEYPILGFSYDVTTGDFNGDGKLDLAAVNLTLNTVSVLLGNGDGTFQLPVQYPVGWQPSVVVVGDFNGDGKLDLAVSSFSATASACSNQCQSIVSILLGNGDGTFQPHVDFATGGLTPLGMAAGDLNGDGELDLVIANGQVPSNAVSVLLGNGDGTFQAPLNYSTDLSPLAVAVGDLNGDGKADLAVLNHDIGGTNVTVVSVFIGNGDGTFQHRVDYDTSNGATGVVPNEVVIGDFRGNGMKDLAVSSAYGVDVLLGNGNGTFQEFVTYSTAGSLCGSAFTCEGGLAAGDFDGDGRDDIVAAVDEGITVDILFSNADGTFQAPELYVATSVITPYGPFTLAAGDFNGDKKLDLVAPADAALAILLNNGSGGFEVPRSYATGNDPENVVTADFNADGKLDLAIVNSLDSTVSILLGNGDGTFQTHVDYPTGAGAYSIVAADFNGDGKPDLAVGNGSGVSILLGKGDGTFQPHVDYSTGAGQIAAGDFNGDGKLDLAVANGSGSGTVSILLGNGDGTFQPHVDYPAVAGANSPIAADFNGDGRLDLAVIGAGTTAGNGTIAILLNRGDGTLLPPVTYSAGGVASRLAGGPFNQDGYPDLAVVNGGETCVITKQGQQCSYGTGLAVLLNNGDGTFQQPVTYPTLSYPENVVVADINRDGIPDVIVANGICTGAACSGFSVSVFWGKGDGTFHPRLDYEVGFVPRGAAVGDFNGDMKPDLAVTDSINNEVTVLLNNLTGSANVLTASTSFFSGGPLGIVFTQPAGIICGAVGGYLGAEALCNATYSVGASVTVVPEPPPGESLTSWNGDCTGTGNCVLDMNADHSVTANFATNKTTYTVTVTEPGTGTGIVAASPDVGGINCGTTCSAAYTAGATVVLGASANSGSIFAGWDGGGCTANMIDCNLTVNSNLTVTANFEVPGFSLTPASTALNLQSGGQGTDVLTLAGQPFAGAIQLSCAVTGPAPMPTCALSPTTVTPGGGSASSKLTVTAPGMAAQLTRYQLGKLSYALCLPLTFGILMLGRSEKQRRVRLIFCGTSLLLLLLLPACGGSGSHVPSNYTLTVTGTSGSIQHTAQIMVTVQ